MIVFGSTGSGVSTSAISEYVSKIHIKYKIRALIHQHKHTTNWVEMNVNKSYQNVKDNNQKLKPDGQIKFTENQNYYLL